MKKYIRIWFPGGCSVTLEKGEILTMLHGYPEIWEKATKREKIFRRKQRRDEGCPPDRRSKGKPKSKRGKAFRNRNAKTMQREV